MKTTVQRRIALLAGLFVVSLLVVGTSAQAASASAMGGPAGRATAAKAASAGSAAPSSVSSASVKVPLTQWQTRRLLDAWAGKGQLGIVPVAPGVRGPGAVTSSGRLSGGTEIALIMGTAAIAALFIGSIATIAMVRSERKQQQEPVCVGEGC